MIKTYYDFLFSLDNGSTYKLSVNDVVDNANVSQITDFADLLIQKECHRNSRLFTSLMKCTKRTVEEEVLLEET